MGVAGGDPESKKEDTEDDGSGGPGYTIPNESGSPRARRHFRGSLTMFNADTPERVGSQLMITLCSQPRMDGHFAVFGRVLKGQKVVDAITVGRTTKNVGKFGRVIPGDLLFKAEVIRKRPHEYKVIKLKK
jgi:cyclophilin family peptidyl-prolyl cis-trans isomerase